MQKAPTKIQLHKQSQQLELHFGTEQFSLSAEFLRVHSPSAEVMGHGPNQAVLQFGKKDVRITKIERAGNYAIKLFFDDGHDSGIFTWTYLYELGATKEKLWQDYLEALMNAGKTREKDTSIVKFV
ncbi:gamma-butyrobetaine hydroxylase-like domain-containing protein [Cellvibrio sp.]|uniref:gamma-butyrobetaine hydroxylase-like domain-containing protein n=1 Tax=Cellvibrio sp. TaxID=1965322 RepID=UPI0039647E87